MENSTKTPVTFLAIGYRTWGKADTLEGAINNARPNWHGGGSEKKHNKNYTIWRFECEAAEVRVSAIDGAPSYPSGTVYQLIQTSALVK